MKNYIPKDQLFKKMEEHKISINKNHSNLIKHSTNNTSNNYSSFYIEETKDGKNIAEEKQMEVIYEM